MATVLERAMEAGLNREYAEFVLADQRTVVKPEIEKAPACNCGGGTRVVNRWAPYLLYQTIECDKCMRSGIYEDWMRWTGDAQAQLNSVSDVQLPKVFAKMILEADEALVSEGIGPDMTILVEWVHRTYPDL